MEPIGHPTVRELPPSKALLNDHHGPTQPIASTSKLKPRYFKNPWSSYRTATLNDAWLAYQKGAAIALPRPKTPGPSRSQSSASLGKLRSSPEEDEEEEVGNGDNEADEEGVEATTSLLGTSIKLREDFRRVQEEDDEDDWRDPPVEVVPPKWGGVELGNDKETVTWLGHAGVLVQIPWETDGKGKRPEGMCGVIFDPIFSYRCSPSQYVGPARYLDPPCSVSLLPDIHICCISHDHYDHLDYYTIMDLWKYHHSTIHFFVPLGLKQWFTSSGIPSNRVTELDWWHESILSFSPSRQTETTSTYPPEEPDAMNTEQEQKSVLTLKIAFTPAQHRSGRGILDHMTTLWGSWCLGVVHSDEIDKSLEGGMRDWKGFKVFFGGDTGYRYATAPEGDETAVCPAFQEIASLYSPFTLSLLPLSTGSSLPFLRNLLSLSLDQYTLTSSLHCSPADSLDIHNIIKAERTLGIHWGTFCDSDEARGTRVEFGRVRRERGVGKEWVDTEDEGGENIGDGDREGDGKGREKRGIFVVADIGETLVFP